MVASNSRMHHHCSYEWRRSREAIPSLIRSRWKGCSWAFRFFTVRRTSLRRRHGQGMSKGPVPSGSGVPGPDPRLDPRLVGAQQAEMAAEVARRMRGEPPQVDDDPLQERYRQAEREIVQRLNASSRASKLAYSVAVDLVEHKGDRVIHLEAVVPSTGKTISVTCHRFGKRVVPVCRYDGKTMHGNGRRRSGPRLDQKQVVCDEEFLRQFEHIEHAIVAEKEWLLIRRKLGDVGARVGKPSRHVDRGSLDR